MRDSSDASVYYHVDLSQYTNITAVVDDDWLQFCVVACLYYCVCILTHSNISKELR
jgi:hypothetical protein